MSNKARKKMARWHEEHASAFPPGKDRDMHTQKAAELRSEHAPNWSCACEACGEKPTVGDTGLCGPCCFGDASTVGGNW